MDKVTNVLFVGIGGQGVLKASDVLARAAFLSGFDVKKSEIHGMSQRGGGVTSTVRFGAKVYSPLAPTHGIDCLVAFDTVEGEKYLQELAPGAKALFIDGPLLEKVSNPRFANIALLGRMSQALDITAEIWEKAISLEVPERFVQANVEAFRLGRNLEGAKQ